MTKKISVQEVHKLLNPMLESLGIIAVEVPNRSLDRREVGVCPFDSYMIQNNKIFYEKTVSQATALIHELGHCLFGIDQPEEYEWHSWELRVVNNLGLMEQFQMESYDYIITFDGEEMEFGLLSKSELKKYMDHREDSAKKNGSYFVGFETYNLDSVNFEA